MRTVDTGELVVIACVYDSGEYEFQGWCFFGASRPSNNALQQYAVETSTHDSLELL
jgi:hypothetical protein